MARDEFGLDREKLTPTVDPFLRVTLVPLRGKRDLRQRARVLRLCPGYFHSGVRQV